MVDSFQSSNPITLFNDASLIYSPTNINRSDYVSFSITAHQYFESDLFSEKLFYGIDISTYYEKNAQWAEYFSFIDSYIYKNKKSSD